jgi:hypothetical protein
MDRNISAKIISAKAKTARIRSGMKLPIREPLSWRHGLTNPVHMRLLVYPTESTYGRLENHTLLD